MLSRINQSRKSNAILEYGVVLIIVIGAMAGVNSFLQRHIQARIKSESDEQLSHGQGLEWDASITRIVSESAVDRVEEPGADFTLTSQTSSRSISYSPPMPPYVMEHKGSSMHVQDAPMQPPQINNPEQDRSNNYQPDETTTD